MTTAARTPYAGYRFPPEIISHAIWLYFRFPLGLRMVEEMLATRGILVSHETVRQWALKFGQGFANRIRRRLPQAGDKWHLERSPSRLPVCSTGSGARSTRTGWCSTCWSGAGGTGGRQAPAAQAAQAPVPGAPRHGHRQARQLWRGEEGADAWHRASPTQGSQQPGGKLAPADAPTRAADEALQIASAGTEIGRAHV